MIRKLPPLFFVSCLLSFSAFSAQPFSGQWGAESDSPDGTPLSTLSLNLVQQGQNVTGTYCYVTQRGSRIDCPEQGVENLHGTVKGASATVVFDSSFGGEKGKAELTLNDGKLSWSLLAEPQGREFYAPKTYQLDKDHQVQAKSLFIGEWANNSHPEKPDDISMRIWLTEEKGLVKGRYCLIYDNGNRMDCSNDNEDNIHGVLNHQGIALLNFNSWFGEKHGKAEFSVNGDYAHWHLLSPPVNSDHFFPKDIKLTKVSDLYIPLGEKNTFFSDAYIASVFNNCGKFTSDCSKVQLLLIDNKTNDPVILDGKVVKDSFGKFNYFIFNDQAKNENIKLDHTSLTFVDKNGQDVNAYPGRWNNAFSD